MGYCDGLGMTLRSIPTVSKEEEAKEKAGWSQRQTILLSSGKWSIQTF